ncbi:MAG: response regulator [Proteobacteria bacterium]|nr:response regulator [Pseudomonadota bacterium]
MKDESDNQYDSTLATLKYKATPIGRLSVNIPKSETTRKVFETIGLLIIIASAVLICMLLITIGVVERFSQPILDLTESASEIASGNLEVLIDIERDDELGSLAQSFAFMRDAIKENITEIKEEIEERKKAEESLRTSERELNSIIKNTPDIIFRLDPDGRITFISDSVKKYGYAPGEMIGRDFFKLVHPGDRDRTRNRINERRTGNRKTTSLEIGFLAKDQSTARVESAAKGAHNGVKVFLIEAEGLYSAEKSATDNFLGTQGIARDITARKRAQEDKLALERRLQRVEKDESLSRMASAVAHHFNNMLAVTIGNLEMAMENLPLGTDLAESLDEAQKAARSAAEMSGLMLTFLGQSWGKPKLLDLSDFCRRQLTRLRAAMPPDVHLETELLSPGPVINADPAQLRQVLSALFTNAWEAMNGSAGEVRVSVDTVEAADIPGGRRFPVKWAPSAGARARLAISDTGRGMDAETVNRIFDPFYTDKFTGRGLGLAVTLGIVKGCNGAITVESEPDRGSTFQVFLPLSGERVPRPEGAKAIETQYIAGETVLLVENNEAVRNMAKVMLERIGFKILTARDGPEAVEIFRENREDIRLVISDLSMPGMDGWETLDLLRSIRPDIPVILVSDNDEALVMAEDHPEQPQAFMHKPFRMKTLKEILGRVLGCERAQGP